MEQIFSDFKQAHLQLNGYLLASTITPAASKSHAGHLYDFFTASNSYSIQTDLRYAIVYNSDLELSQDEGKAWLEVFIAFWKAVGDVLAAEETINQEKPAQSQWNKVYDSWKEVVNALIQGYTKGAFLAWTIPCLYTAGYYLRNFAIKADSSAAKAKGNVTFNAGYQDDVVGSLGKHEKLEDAARQINRIFGLCISDRAPIEESRKWALYYTMNLLFKTYFKLNSITLSKNILRTVQASTADMPPLEAYPKAHIVTFNYYVGVIFFLEEDYAKAEDHLTQAWRLCHKSAQRNLELILTYLIPCRLLTAHTLPTESLLGRYPRLKELFGPFSECIKRGDLAGFSAALTAGQDEFVKRRIYLTLERGRDIALRNLFRKVFLAGGFEAPKEGEEESKARVRRTRIPVHEFAAALRLGMGSNPAETLDMDEVECLIANMIYKNLMKGYIARERGMVVLSKGGAFPGTGV